MYHHIVEMAKSRSLSDRITGCAALQGHTDPAGFASRNMMKIVSAAGWATAWESAQKQADNPKYNPDIGQRTDVITDVMILTVAQPLIVAEQPPA